MKAKVLTIKHEVFEDKNDKTKKVEMNKLTLLIENEGICEMWTQKEVPVGAVVELGITVGKNYKPVVKLV